MRTRVGVVAAGALLVLLGSAIIGPDLPNPAGAAGIKVAPKSCPYLVRFDQVKMEIVEIAYTDEVEGVDGNRMKLSEEKRKHFRLALVTVRVRKPAGMRLSVAAADFTIHYYHGGEPEVAPCEGISSFSQALDVDRPMKLPRTQGPGWVKQTTGARSTQAAEVYIDTVFAMVEPDTREVWICVGQPTTTQPFMSQGWK